MDFTSSPSHVEKFNRTLSHSREKDISASKSTAVTHGNALKLGSKKASNKKDKSSKAPRQAKVKTPGSEFDIMQVAVSSSEPDYFADMEPAVNFKVKDSKVIPMHPHSEQLSVKLAMVEDTAQV